MDEGTAGTAVVAPVQTGDRRRRTAGRSLAAGLAMCFVLLGGASSAWAGVGFSIVPSVPQQVTVGMTVPGALSITNQSTDAVAGEVGYETDSYQLDDITLVPSCGSQVVGPDCPAGSWDPGVLVPSPLTATGRAGTACAGRTFSLVLDAMFPQGKYRFIPDAPVVLGPSSGSLAVRRCIIDFTLFVARAPTIDSDPDAGVQTDQKASTAGHDITPGVNFNQPGGGTGSAQTTVSPAPTAISTTATPELKLGAGSISDVATITGRVSPVGPASVTFQLYGPNDATCAGAPIFTSTVSVPNAPASPVAVTSAAFTPTQVGSYRWIASYSGDANNAPSAGSCGDVGETTVVSQATPSITTDASDDMKLGGTLSDVATITGRSNPSGAATVTFRLYGPSDATCTGTPVFTSTVSVPAAPVSPVSVTSASFTPTAVGTYRWVASYSGDDNNAAVSGACNDANENTVVSKATPAITTDASNDVKLPGQLTDVATITGRISPAGASTVTFRLYGPDDASCSGTPVFTSTVAVPAAPVSPVSVTSASYTPTAVGTYRWIASFSGDDNNAAVSGACNDADESVSVSKATPSITTDASDDMKLGGMLSDVATITGRSNPSGASTVTFRLYGPADTTCTGTPVFTSTVSVPAAPVSPVSVTSASFTPTAVGTYRWVASYSGDDNNAAVSGACNDADENTTVAKATPSSSTEASDDMELGGMLKDVATITGRSNPSGASTVTFRLYGPSDATCTGAPVFTSTVSVPAAPVSPVSVTSASFTPTAVGTYRWVASYTGDDNNAAVSGACNDADENTIVTKATPDIATRASADIKLGATVSDVATITGRINPSGPSSVTFRLYGPDDATCTGTPVFTSTVSVPSSPVSPVSVSSASFTPTTGGTYRWIASYSGDDNNAAAAGACNDPDELVVVAKATPSISTDASDDMKLGGTLTDVATITGRTTPSGSSSVTFRLYGPGDATCTGTPVFTSTVSVPAAPVSPVSVTSASFTPTAVGTYRWVASYSGDDSNAAVSGACNDADENTIVSKATPAITTDASDDMKLGGDLRDVATITGRRSPAGTSTVTFRLYGPNDATCSGAVAFTSTIAVPSSPVSPVTVTSAPFTPATVGTYRWVASYSGDDNNAAVSGACNDADENTIVAKATPDITTQASPDVTFGSGTLTDTATVTGLVNPVKGAGEATVEFRLYGPNDATCATAVFTSSNRPLTFNAQSTSATATSAPYTPPATGRYRWRAFYAGDANNAPISGPCNAANESADVRPASPAIATQASAEIVLGAGTLSDTATVSGLVDPISGAGAGTVEFRLYGPDDATCATAIFTSAARPLMLDTAKTTGTASSAAFTPTAAGTYRWRAFYSGDANNNAVSGACTDVNEQTTVKPPAAPPVVVPPPAVTPPPPPASKVSPVSIVEQQRGTSTIRGRTGCQGSPFRVTVSGREIEQVVFTLDGKIVRVLTAPNSGSRYVLPVNPRRVRSGVHRILARVVYTKQSGTRSRTLRTTFSRCARRAVAPAFTGYAPTVRCGAHVDLWPT